MNEDIHIGNLIKETLHNHGRSIGWLAKQISCDRSNFYRILQKQSIDTQLLFRISRIMQHDFFVYYSKVV